MKVTEFKNRMQLYKQAKGQNPLLKYYDWKNKYADGTDGVTDHNDYKQHIQKEYDMQSDLYDINHTDPTTGEKNPFYNRLTDDYGIVELPEISVTAPKTWENVNAQKARRGREAYYEGAKTAFNVAAPIVGGAGLASMAGAGLMSAAINPLDIASIAVDPKDPLNYLPFVGQSLKSGKYLHNLDYIDIPNIKIGNWSYKFPEYGNPNKAFRLINKDAVDDYLLTGIVGPESIEHNMERASKNYVKNEFGLNFIKHFSNHVMFNKERPFYGVNSKYSNLLVGDLNNPNIKWSKVNHKGHKNIVEPGYNGEFNTPIDQFDIWHKSKIGWVRDLKATKYADGGVVEDKINPWAGVSLTKRLEYYDELNPALGYGPSGFFSAFLTSNGLAKRTKAPQEDENRWKAYLGLPYDKKYVPDSNIRFESDYDYPNRQYTGLSIDAKNEVRNEVIPKVRRLTNSNKSLNDQWIQVLDHSLNSTQNSKSVEHTRLNHLGDLANFGIRENNGSGIYEIGDLYDFPFYIPIPDRKKGTELMVRDTVWSDKAKPELYIPRKKNKK